LIESLRNLYSISFYIFDNEMRVLLSILAVFLSIKTFAQERNGKAISYNEQMYDQSYITPYLKGKHAFSLGFMNVQTTPDPNLTVNQSIHLGYNYLILKERKLLLALRDIDRTEMNSLGVHFTYVNPQEHYLMGTFNSSFLAAKGRLMSFYFLSEVGLGYHYKRELQDFDQNKLNISFLVDFVRFRPGRIPLYLHFSGTYALSNNLFNKTPIMLGYMFGLRYYFYKK